MREQLRTHRAAILAVMGVTVLWSVAGLARGDIEAALLAWALPAAVLIGLWWEAHGDRRR